MFQLKWPVNSSLPYAARSLSQPTVPRCTHIICPHNFVCPLILPPYSSLWSQSSSSSAPLSLSLKPSLFCSADLDRIIEPWYSIQYATIARPVWLNFEDSHIVLRRRSCHLSIWSHTKWIWQQNHGSSTCLVLPLHLLTYLVELEHTYAHLTAAWPPCC